jgi:hypothetical protein
MAAFLLRAGAAALPGVSPTAGPLGVEREKKSISWAVRVICAG